MKALRAPATLLFLALAFSLSSCETTSDGGSGRRYAPAVYIPSDLNENEDRYLSDVEDVLRDAGYRPSNSRSSEYELYFTLEDGPINSDATLKLLRDGSEVASAYARVGGPRIILSRQEVVRESFDKALGEFERRLPSAGSRGYDSYNRRSSGYERDRDNDDDEYYDRRSAPTYGY